MAFSPSVKSISPLLETCPLPNYEMQDPPPRLRPCSQELSHSLLLLFTQATNYKRSGQLNSCYIEIHKATAY